MLTHLKDRWKGLRDGQQIVLGMSALLIWIAAGMGGGLALFGPVGIVIWVGITIGTMLIVSGIALWKEED